MQRLLVSVRGKNEAIEAVRGGAHIIDAEYPGSALGTPYPLNIHTIRSHVPLDRLVSTNIGEKQFVWSTAAQAAVGVAFAGADIVKVGLAELDARKAATVMSRIVRHVRYWFPWKILVPAFFADSELRSVLDPVTQGVQVAVKASAQGVLIDTFFKERGRGVLDYLDIKEVKAFVKTCHAAGLEAWVAGSVTKPQLPPLWDVGVDVVCVRGAACEAGKGRMGQVKASAVRSLVATIPAV